MKPKDSNLGEKPSTQTPAPNLSSVFYLDPKRKENTTMNSNST